MYVFDVGFYAELSAADLIKDLMEALLYLFQVFFTQQSHGRQYLRMCERAQYIVFGQQYVEFFITAYCEGFDPRRSIGGCFAPNLVSAHNKGFNSSIYPEIPSWISFKKINSSAVWLRAESPGPVFSAGKGIRALSDVVGLP